MILLTNLLLIINSIFGAFVLTVLAINEKWANFSLMIIAAVAGWILTPPPEYRVPFGTRKIQDTPEILLEILYYFLVVLLITQFLYAAYSKLTGSSFDTEFYIFFLYTYLVSAAIRSRECVRSSFFGILFTDVSFVTALVALTQLGINSATINYAFIFFLISSMLFIILYNCRYELLILIEKIPFLRPQELKDVDDFFFRLQITGFRQGLFVKYPLIEMHSGIIRIIRENRKAVQAELKLNRTGLKATVIHLILSYIIKQIQYGNGVFYSPLSMYGESLVKIFDLVIDDMVQEKEIDFDAGLKAKSLLQDLIEISGK